MRLQIESTPEIKDIDGIQCRVWKATTPKGVECFLDIHRVIVPKDADASEFDAALEVQIDVAPRGGKCRRCSECPNSTHHWIDNSDFGNEDGGDHPNNSHVCKHCTAFGNECTACGGNGQGETISGTADVDDFWDCVVCKGEGVIPVMESIAEASNVDRSSL